MAIDPERCPNFVILGYFEKSRQPHFPVRVVIELEVHGSLELTGIHLEELSL